MQVRLMWGTRWGITRIAFTLSRYMPFAGVIMTCYGKLRRDYWLCIPFGKVSNGIHYVCIISSEGLLILRTYAIWECSRKLLISLLLTPVGSLLLIMYGRTNLYKVNPGGCTFETNKNTVLQYVPLAFYEIGKFCLALTLIH
ncbi:hypothetical protein BV22DRAFT_1025860 [Leucogyrophana mollusca]|uniref:Uncharacterized protein n=1 Tax=Leucogyrophana mollusca TaxID=85980 RepID=A0ACB8AW15_9AGAM|nr:hypothetical protein BV22DRAFT_1025860 [Leucogyrophana mollusca]